MIPLRDTVRYRYFPIINWILIAITTLVFLFELSLRPAGLFRLISLFGLVPYRLHLNQPLLLLSNPLPLITLYTSMFLHNGWFHFLSNVWVLHVFGNNVEDRMGPGRYLVFYTLSGIAANLVQALLFPSSTIPAIGASGAIAGVMGAYFLYYPRARITTLIPILLIPWFIEVPAIIYLGFWFISQLFSGFLSLGISGGAGIAWWAHTGGFLFGLVFARRLAARRPLVILHYPDGNLPD